jgi:hypothetical protein
MFKETTHKNTKMDIKKNFLFIKYLQYINGHHSSNKPTNHLAIELQHISKKYPILSVFYRYQKRFKYHILAHILILRSGRGYK